MDNALIARCANALGAGAIILAVLVIGGCKSDTQPATDAAPKVEGDRVSFAPGSPGLKTLALANATVGNGGVYRLTGRIVWDEDRTVRVYSPFAGRVETLRVSLGSRVRAGETLAIIGSPDFGQAQAELRKAEADYALADKTAERQRELLDHGVIPAKDLQGAEADLQRAQAELARVRARAKLYASDGTDQGFPLRSPLPGVVVDKSINPGQEVRPDQMTSNMPPLFVITEPERLTAQLDATERDLAVLAIGQTVMLRTPAYPDETFTARIESIADFVDPVTRMIKIRASVDNAQRKLKGEMFVTAEIEDQTKHTLMIPAGSTFLVGTKHYAFVERGAGQFERLAVDVGRQSEGLVVVAGVAPSQRVVTAGALFLEQLVEGGS